MIRRGLGRAGALLVTAAFLVPAGPLPSAAADTHRLDNRVLIHVDEVSPTTPTPTTKPQQLKVTLTLTNTTDDPIEAMRVIGERGNPIGNMNQLTASTENPVPPIGGLPMPSQPPLTIDLDRHAETTVDFVTTTSTLDDGKGICICSSALTGPLIYPLFFSAHAVIDGVDNVLGFASTYLPAFYAEPEPLRVGWVWPLLDRPHRLLDDTVFTDDELATSLSSGRLSRALEVVEQVGSRVPLTLLVDPELLDEIEVMATEPYSVSQPDGKAVAGAGEAAAAAWLDRLRAVLLDDPGVTVRLTPYADPDVETLTERGLKWSIALPAAMVPRILDALAGRPLDMSLSWPVAGAVGPATLRRLYGQGIRTLLLNASAVALSGPDGSVPPGIVNLEPDREATDSQIAGVLQFPPIQREIARAITAGGEGVAALPKAVAQLAIRAVQEPDLEHAVVIAAPRYVDPDVAAAVRTIEETSDSFFARPIALQDAVADSGLSSTQLGRLTKVPSAVISDLPPTLAGPARRDLRSAHRPFTARHD